MESKDMIIQTLSHFSEVVQNFSLQFIEMQELLRKIAAQTPPQLLDKETLCRKLNISQRTLYRNIKEYQIPVHRLGKRIYFYWDEVESYLSKKKQ